MFIRLKELAKTTNSVAIDETIDLSDVLKHRTDLLGFGQVEAHLSARHTGENAAEVTGSLEIDVEQPCSRCLEPVKQRLDIPFHETFALAADESEPEDEDEDIHFVTDEKIELMPYVIENVLVALPYAPLCEEECKGLCPVCGSNRNMHECGCKQDTTDPRLAGLADFFKQ
ncbi:YceD family protein [Paenibacillus doosanensis]|nr:MULTISPECIES: YceD family protein [Paenibacillus]MCS7459493.1 YceD family protein [Paenibacillus doosanensis]